MPSTVRDSWMRLERWYAANVPEDLPTWPAGASLSQIEAAERCLQLRFPAELCESYLIHDGSEDAPFLEVYSLLSITEVVRKSKLVGGCLLEQYNAQLIGQTCLGVRPSDRQVKWIKIMDDGAGDGLIVDLTPDAGGLVGQVFYWNHEEGPRRVVAASFGELLDKLANALERRRYYCDADARCFYPVDPRESIVWPSSPENSPEEL
jgi:cell wall assembly regulator SMI1